MVCTRLLPDHRPKVSAMKLSHDLALTVKMTTAMSFSTGIRTTTQTVGWFGSTEDPTLSVDPSRDRSPFELPVCVRTFRRDRISVLTYLLNPPTRAVLPRKSNRLGGVGRKPSFPLSWYLGRDWPGFSGWMRHPYGSEFESGLLRVGSRQEEEGLKTIEE